MVVVAVTGALLAAALLGCGPPVPGRSAPPPGLLFVANYQDATLTVVDGRTGGRRVLGNPMPAGTAPWRVVSAPGGNLLVLSYSPGQTGELTHVAWSGRGWASRRVPIEPGSRLSLLSGDGERWGVVFGQLLAPDPGGGPRCRVSLVELRTGHATGSRPLACGGLDVPLSLALDGGPGGPIAYLGVWTPESPGGGRGASGKGRILVVNPATGTLTGAVTLRGAPQLVRLAPAPGNVGRRLYVAEADPDHETADRWNLLALDPVTLQRIAEFPLPMSPLALSVTPDGSEGYVLGPAGAITGLSRVARIDLSTGAARGLAALPAWGIDLALAGDHLYVAGPDTNQLWVVDRGRGTLIRSIRVGRWPVAVVSAMDSQ